MYGICIFPNFLIFPISLRLGQLENPLAWGAGWRSFLTEIEIPSSNPWAWASNSFSNRCFTCLETFLHRNLETLGSQRETSGDIHEQITFWGAPPGTFLSTLQGRVGGG